MKISCRLVDARGGLRSSSDLEAVLYGRSENSANATAGASVLRDIEKKKFAPASRAWDVLSIALAIAVADAAAHRKDSPDGWTRQIDLDVAVEDQRYWAQQSGMISECLRFLTTDVWTMSFSRGGLAPECPARPRLPAENCVVLLSGGLDSFVGAIDLTAGGQSPYVVSQVSRGDKNTQQSFANDIGNGLTHLQLNHNVSCPGRHEPSQRARSMIFLAYGTLIATSLRRYKLGERVTLYVCENGLISVNPPLTGARLGSLSTRTTHPVFLRMFQKILDDAGLNIQIENPYRFTTKGEMLSKCADQSFLRERAHKSTSCGRFARNVYRHCGRCVPCLIRRASFHAWGVRDATEYVFADLAKEDPKHSGFDDVRSAAMAVADIEARGFDRWIATTVNSSAVGGGAGSYKDVVRRGLDEVATFLKAAGVR